MVYNLLVVLMLLGGCSTITTCPVLVNYTEEFNDELANEIYPLKNDSAIVRAMLDYSGLRAQVRVCQ